MALKFEDNTIFQPERDNPPVKQKKYRKRQGMKSSKARERRYDSRMKQVKEDCMSEIRVHYVLQ